MSHTLQPGVMLDGRYRVDHVLGQGGFGITYAAENTRIGLKVAVKELFWKDHCLRDSAVSTEVALADERDVPVFDKQKERFLREARTLRDFSRLSGIVHVIDYFETNATAYIVMELVEGETLGGILAREHRMDAEALLRRMLPLIDNLDQIHRAEIIHRDISPDNIMVRADGSLTLLDFGAARDFVQEVAKPYTTIAKASYSPGELYDQNGRQGPWTDVYSLCATLYHCIVGTAPLSAVQRLFLDELRAPSELGISLDPRYEKILMKGLQLEPSGRYQSMKELAQDIREALPAEKPASPGEKKLFFIGFAAGLVCLIAVVGLLLWRQTQGVNKFRGIETEQLRATADEDMTAAEFAAAQEDIKNWLDGFAGPENYLMSVNGTAIDIILPLAVYEGREIYETTLQAYNEFIRADGKKPLKLTNQIQAKWEVPQSALYAGANQVSEEELRGETLLLVFKTNQKLTRAGWVGLIMEFKTRLDALDRPYAIGTLYGDDRQLVIRIAPDHIGSVILDSVGGNSLCLTGDWSVGPYIACSYNADRATSAITPLEKDGQLYGLRYERLYDYDETLEELTRAILKDGGNMVYLQSDDIPIAQAEIDRVISDGTIDFTSFCFSDAERIDAETQWVIRYIDAMLNETDLTSLYRLENVQVLDENGTVLFDEDPAGHYGVFVRDKPSEARLNEKLRRISEEKGYRVSGTQSGFAETYAIHLDLPVDEQLPEQIEQAVSELAEEYGLAELRCDRGLDIFPVEEQEDEYFRLVLSTRYDYDTGSFYNCLVLYLADGGRLAPFAKEMERWWDEFDPEPLGLRKNRY